MGLITDRDKAQDPGAELRRRWRLVLGRHADQPLQPDSEVPDGPQSKGKCRAGAGRYRLLDQADRRRDQLLDFLYQREYQGRQYNGRQGGSGDSAFTAPEWLRQVRELFPHSTVEVLQHQALERYGLQELITDPEVLATLPPSMDLVRTLISYRSLLPPEAMRTARHLIRQVVRQLEDRLAQRIRNAVLGPRHLHRRGGRPSLNGFDWPTTLRHNLRHYDLEQDALVLERLFFFQRQQQQVPWELIILVDQSGSMLDSTIHAAVTAAIFSGLRSIRTRLLLFDTRVLDVTEQVRDPVEVLLGVQLGGGTDIAAAMEYAARLIHNPRRTLLVLISDFYEGGNPGKLLDRVRRLRESGVTQLGLAALDQRADPDYDHHTAQHLVAEGMEIAAMTPERLADWVGSKLA